LPFAINSVVAGQDEENETWNELAELAELAQDDVRGHFANKFIVEW